MFRSVAGQLLLEYLVALADRYKDDYFSKSVDAVKIGDLEFLKGQLALIEEIAALPRDLKMYKPIETK